MERVSCLMLTFDRLDHFRRSLRCYCNQFYDDKELVVVCHGDEAYKAQIRQEIKIAGRSDVRTVFLARRLPLGALRNLAVEAASGELLCQWDDDDLSHPDRVGIQVAALEACGADACFLVDHLHLFSERRQVFWCDWTRASRDLGHAGTLLARKCSLPRYDPFLPRGEDSRMQEMLCGRGARIALIRGMGHLYVYTYHGQNVSGGQHHERIARCFGLERDTITQRLTIIGQALDEHLIEPPVDIVDHLGERVFTWNRAGLNLVNSQEAELQPVVFSLVSNGSGGDTAASCRMPWYVDTLRATVEKSFTLPHFSRTPDDESAKPSRLPRPSAKPQPSAVG